MEKMGKELGELFWLLSNEVLWLHIRWGEYKELYNHDPKCFESMNEVAEFFFGLLQHIMLDDIVLSVCRLSDPAKMQGKSNLSFERLCPFLENHGLTASPTKMSDMRETDVIDDAFKKMAEARDSLKMWRDKRIAHRDLDHIRASIDQPPEGVDYSTIERALEAMADILNEISGYFTGGMTKYNGYVLSSCGAESLVFGLRELSLFRRLRSERELQGEYDPREWL